MREHLDCAVLATPATMTQARRLQGSHLAGRLLVHALAADESVHSLCDFAMPLRRFDVLLLAVSPANLSWVRMHLQRAQGVVTTPIIAVAHDLRAPALNDLFALGMGDFLREPYCLEELRARCERLLARHGAAAPEVAAEAQFAVPTLLPPYAAALRPVASQLLVQEAEVPSQELASYAAAAAAQGGDAGASLRLAKSKMVEHFETAYIKAALLKHDGNIAMAARSAQKHRRAFWALMRKYEIDPAPFRAGGHPKRPHPGKMPANFSEG